MPGKQNDHVELMKQIEEGLCSFYSSNKKHKSEDTTPEEHKEPKHHFQTINVHEKPFARVNAVTAGSPAAEVVLFFPCLPFKVWLKGW